MKRVPGFLLLGGALLTGGLALATNLRTDACDLKTIEDGYYCEECEEVLAGDSLIKGEYCTYCYEDAVENERTPQKAKKIKVCVKTCYQCPDCEELFESAGKCEDCEVKLEKATIRARVLFACQECGKEFDKAGFCDEEDCKDMKAKVVRTCSLSGEFPHVAGK